MLRPAESALQAGRPKLTSSPNHGLLDARAELRLTDRGHLAMNGSVRIEYQFARDEIAFDLQ